MDNPGRVKNRLPDEILRDYLKTDKDKRDKFVEEIDRLVKEHRRIGVWVRKPDDY